jgi:hypothetical protein
VVHIIGALAHLPQVGEELGSPLHLLCNATTDTTMRRRGTQGIERIIPSLGPSFRGHHLWNIQIMVTKCKRKGFHPHLLTFRKLINGHNMGEKTLYKLELVGGHALLHRHLQLTEDEITATDLLQIIWMAIAHQVDMVMATTSLVTGLACKILPEELGQGVVVVVHASNPRR